MVYVCVCCGTVAMAVILIQQKNNLIIIIIDTIHPTIVGVSRRRSVASPIQRRMC